MPEAVAFCESVKDVPDTADTVVPYAIPVPEMPIPTNMRAFDAANVTAVLPDEVVLLCVA